jgi:hypothetical protein
MQSKDVENLPKGNGIAVGSLRGTTAFGLIQPILAFCPHIQRSRERLSCDPIGHDRNRTDSPLAIIAAANGFGTSSSANLRPLTYC